MADGSIAFTQSAVCHCHQPSAISHDGSLSIQIAPHRASNTHALATRRQMRGKRRVRSAEPPARTEPAACTRGRSCMQRVLSGRAVLRLLAAAVLAFGLSRLLAAAAPSSATISAANPSAAWDGFGAVAASPDGEATCVEGTNCDIFTLTLAPADYRGKRVRVKASWTNQLNDYDVYVHQGSLDGPVLTPANGGAPSTAEESTFDVNAIVTAGVNDTYTIHVVYFGVVSVDPYHGAVSLEAIPATTANTRTASIVSGAKSGLAFSRSRALYAFGAGQDVEPSVRVDYQGNAYVGAIRGLTGGNDLWRFDLNPSSATYDPFLTAATPVWRADGTLSNPAYKGQPDALAPNNDSDLGGDGGGDMDLAVGFRPAAASAMPPLLATSSLVAANVSVQRSSDRGETMTNNPAGNTTVPVDDRQWMEFLGDHTVYLGYRDFTGLQATSKYYLNRSDDGGLTYGPAVVAAIGGNTTGNIDVDQRDGTVYFCHQGDGTEGAKEVRVAVGHPSSLALTPAVFNTFVAAAGQKPIANLFPVCKVASDGTVYVAYSDGGDAIYVAHSFDHGSTWALPVRVSDMGPGGVALFPWIETGDRPGSLAIVWYGATAADSEDGAGGNTDRANWKAYFAQTLTAAPQVFDFRHDARAVSPPPVMPDQDSPADILTIGYGCQIVNGATWITATMTASGLDTVPPDALWRMNFATNPTKPGLVDRADQWFVEADTDAGGVRTFSWGTAARQSNGSIVYTIKGAADSGAFDLTRRSVTVKVDAAKLNAVQTRGPVAAGTVLMGLRGSATTARTVVAGTASAGFSDSTRAGGTFTMGSCQP